MKSRQGSPYNQDINNIIVGIEKGLCNLAILKKQSAALVPSILHECQEGCKNQSSETCGNGGGIDLRKRKTGFRGYIYICQYLD